MTLSRWLPRRCAAMGGSNEKPGQQSTEQLSAEPPSHDPVGLQQAGQQSIVPQKDRSAAAEKPSEPAVQVTVLDNRPKQIVPDFETLKQRLSENGDVWSPDKVWYKTKKKLGRVTGKTLVTRMNSQQLNALQGIVREHIQKDEHQGTRDLLEKTRKTAEKFKGKEVQLPYILILHASTWELTLNDGEIVPNVSFFELDFRGEPKKETNADQSEPKKETKKGQKSVEEIAQSKCTTNQCTQRGFHQGQCASCDTGMSQLSGAMTSALVDGFSGPMEIAVTSCIGLPRTWNFNAGLAETCGICFCCYFLPHNFKWFEVWCANVQRDALVGKSTPKRFAIAIVDDGGEAGNFMQQMELPFAYLYDLPVLLLEASIMRRVFIETGLMERTVQFVTGSDDNTLRMWSHRGKQEGEMTVGNTVNCVDIMHDWIFAGDNKGVVHKYRRSDFIQTESKKVHAKEVNALKVALGFVFTAGNDQFVKISQIGSLEEIHQFKDGQGLGRVLCISVGIEFYFVGGESGAMRLSHKSLIGGENMSPIGGVSGVSRRPSSETKMPPKPTTIKQKRTGQLCKDISHMALNGRSLFMTSKADLQGNVYFLDDAYMTEDALEAKVVFTAGERVWSLALGGKELFVATAAIIYKLDAANAGEHGPTPFINVTPLNTQLDSKVWVLQVFGEIAVVGYIGSKELGIFNTNNGKRMSLPEGAFEGHKNNIGCIAIG